MDHDCDKSVELEEQHRSGDAWLCAQEVSDLLRECAVARDAANAPLQLVGLHDEITLLHSRCRALVERIAVRRPEEAMAAGLVSPPIAHTMPATSAARVDFIEMPSEHNDVVDLTAAGGLERFVALQVELASAGSSAAPMLPQAGRISACAGVTSVAGSGAATISRALRARADREELLRGTAAPAPPTVAGETSQAADAEAELQELEGATELLLQGAQSMQGALRASMGKADAIAGAVARNLQATEARLASLKQHSSAVGWTFLGHIAAVIAASGLFAAAYLLVRILPRGSVY